MRKIFTIIVLMLVMGSLSIAQETPKKSTKKTKNNTINFTVLPGKSIEFDFFLDNTYETVIYIYENSAQVFTANSGIQPTGIYKSPVNTSPSNINYTLQVVSKCVRSGHIRFQEGTLNIKQVEIGYSRVVSTSLYGTACPSIQNAVINVNTGPDVHRPVPVPPHH